MKPYKWAILLSLILGFRLGYALLTPEGRQGPIADATVYWSMGINLAHGEGLHHENAYSIRPPGYPLFLGGICALLGPSLLGAKLIQILLAGVTGLLLFKITSFYYDERAAWAAGIIYAVSYDSFIIPAEMMSENLYAFLLVLSVYVLVRGRHLLASLAFTALYATRQESLLFIAAIVCVYAYLDFKGNLKKILMIALALLAFNSAWAYRNWKIHHRLVIGTTESETHLYLSNVYIFQRLGDRLADEHNIMTLPPEGGDETEMRRRNQQSCVELFSRQPLYRFLLAPFLKLGFFLYPFRPAYDLTYMWILPFWLLGLYLYRHDWREKYPLYAVFCIVLGLLAVFHAVPRYRGPLFPFMAIFAGAALVKLWPASLKNRLLISAWLLANVAVYIEAGPIRLLAKRLLP
ncbi:MAG: glycosyltransferase family 39 protein [Elusimicrobiota bacterium]|jgi:4-amino-4-deoxy-L-arabinose transferase-like glycosyltransferase